MKGILGSTAAKKGKEGGDAPAFPKSGSLSFWRSGSTAAPEDKSGSTAPKKGSAIPAKGSAASASVQTKSPLTKPGGTGGPKRASASGPLQDAASGSPLRRGSGSSPLRRGGSDNVGQSSRPVPSAASRLKSASVAAMLSAKASGAGGAGGKLAPRPESSSDGLPSAGLDPGSRQTSSAVTGNGDSSHGKSRYGRAGGKSEEALPPLGEDVDVLPGEPPAAQNVGQTPAGKWGNLSRQMRSTSVAAGEGGPETSPGNASAPSDFATVVRSATVSGLPGKARALRSNSIKPRSGEGVVFISMDVLVETASEHLAKLTVEDGGDEDKAAAAGALRAMAKEGPRPIKAIVTAGALQPLVGLLRSEHEATVENCVTTVLNVALDEKAKVEVMKIDGFVAAIVHVLKSGSLSARSSAAATICCISTLEGARDAIYRAGALPGLVDLLVEGDAQGKRDAANCFLSLCISRDMRLPVVESGAVPVLCSLLQDGSVDVDTQCASIFAALTRIPEGRQALIDAEAIGILAELLEAESEVCKEHAVTALLGLAVNNKETLSDIDELGIITTLDVLSRTGNAQAQAKAAGLMEILSKFSGGE